MPEYMQYIIGIALLGLVFILTGKGVAIRMQGGAQQVISRLGSKGSKNLGLKGCAVCPHAKAGFFMKCKYA